MNEYLLYPEKKYYVDEWSEYIDEYGFRTLTLFSCHGNRIAKIECHHPDDEGSYFYWEIYGIYVDPDWCNYNGGEVSLEDAKKWVNTSLHEYGFVLIDKNQAAFI